MRIDYRGSISFGYAFADRVYANFPAPSYAGVMSGVDAAVDARFAEPDKLFVVGGPAGGELTAQTVGSTRRFKAAVAEKPIVDLASQSLPGVQYGAARIVYGAYPRENPALYWRPSPMSLVATLLIVREQDHNTPPTEAEQFYDALKLLNVPAALVIVPDAGHATLEATPPRLVAEVEMTLDWFGRHGGQAASATWIDP